MSQTFSLQKSRKELRRLGYDTDITEMPYNPWTKRRKDLYSFADLVGIREDVSGVVAIQACGEDAASHVTKILDGYTDHSGKVIGPNMHLPIWLKARNRFFIWSWCLRGAKGKKKLYRLREIEFILKDGEVIAQENPHVQETQS